MATDCPGLSFLIGKVGGDNLSVAHFTGRFRAAEDWGNPHRVANTLFLTVRSWAKHQPQFPHLQSGDASHQTSVRLKVDHGWQVLSTVPEHQEGLEVKSCS